MADRGITSFQGRPADVRSETFYGNPDPSHVQASVNVVSARSSTAPSRVAVRNHTLVGNYDRSYQNFVPGAVTADRSQVALTAYNNATDRTNVFNQTDVTIGVDRRACATRCSPAPKFGHQLTDNFRNTGFFNNTATSMLVPYAQPDDRDAGDVPPERDRRRQPSDDQRRGGVRARPGGAVPARRRWSPACASTTST